MASELLRDLSRASDANNNPLPGATWNFYVYGTTTPQAVYSDDTLGTSLGSVVTADGGGQFVPVYFDASKQYRGILKTAGGTIIQDIPLVNDGLASQLADPAAGGRMIAQMRSASASLRTMFDAVNDRADIRQWLPANWDPVLNANTDYTTEIQAALDEVNSDNGGPGILYFPAGSFRATHLVLGHVNIEGVGANLTSLVYCGAGGTEFVRAKNCNVGIRRIFLDHANAALPPSVMLNLTGEDDPVSGIIDYQTVFDEVFFNEATVAGLMLPAIVNATLFRPRFANGESCMVITSDGTASGNRQVALIGGTVDFTKTNAAQPKIKQIFKVNSAGADSTRIEWLFGRIEGKIADIDDNFAICNSSGDTQPANAVRLCLHGGGFVPNGGLTTQTPAYIRVDKTGAGGWATLELRGWVNGLFGQAFSGNLSAFLHNPVLSIHNMLDCLVDTQVFSGERTHQYGREIYWGEYGIAPLFGGSVCNGFFLSHPTGGGYGCGANAPGGVLSAYPGAVYTDSGGKLWRKDSGAGTTAGWKQDSPLRGSKTFDWASLATATQQSTTVTVTGAAVGDTVTGVSMDQALSGTRLWGEVTAANTVTVYQRNDTGGTVDVTSGTLAVAVLKA